MKVPRLNWRTGLAVALAFIAALILLDGVRAYLSVLRKGPAAGTAIADWRAEMRRVQVEVQLERAVPALVALTGAGILWSQRRPHNHKHHHAS